MCEWNIFTQNQKETKIYYASKNKAFKYSIYCYYNKNNVIFWRAQFDLQVCFSFWLYTSQIYLKVWVNLTKTGHFHPELEGIINIFCIKKIKHFIRIIKIFYDKYIHSPSQFFINLLQLLLNIDYYKYNTIIIFSSSW